LQESLKIQNERRQYKKDTISINEDISCRRALFSFSKKGKKKGKERKIQK